MLKEKKIGELLQEAYLINEKQLQVALKEQDFYPELKLGEILVLHGWLKKETADFFGNGIQIIKKQKSLLIGNIFLQAGLLSENNIKDILQEQKQIGLQFGEIATLKGLIKQETVTFFIENFALYKSKQDYHEHKRKQITGGNKAKLMEKYSLNYQPTKVKVVDLDEISWIG